MSGIWPERVFSHNHNRRLVINMFRACVRTAISPALKNLEADYYNYKVILGPIQVILPLFEEKGLLYPHSISVVSAWLAWFLRW